MSIAKKCEHCGTLFEPKRKGPRPRFCSGRCISRAYYEANREKEVARSRAYQRANREKVNAQMRASDRKNSKAANALEGECLIFMSEFLTASDRGDAKC